MGVSGLGRPSLTSWDALAGASAVGLLAFAYVLVPQPMVQYGAWLAVFAIWMLWFVSFGVRWVYGEETNPQKEGAGRK